MPQLKAVEQSFLESQQSAAKVLKAKIDAVRAELEPLEQEHDALQEQIDVARQRQKEIGEEKRRICAEADYVEVCREYGEVQADVTKLLKKSRK